MPAERYVVRRAPHDSSLLIHLWRIRKESLLVIAPICGKPGKVTTWFDAAPPGVMTGREAAERMLEVGKSSRCHLCYESAWRRVNGSGK